MVRARPKLTRDLILDVAATLFRERGYHKATLEDIASALQVTRPALYGYFESKEELLLALISRGVSRLVQRAQETIAANLPVAAKFARLLASHIETVASSPGTVRPMFEELDRLDPEKTAAIRALWDNYSRHLEALYRQGVAEGLFLDVDPAVAVRTLFGAANWVHKWYRAGERLDPPALAHEMCRLLMNGCLRRERGEIEVSQARRNGDYDVE